MPSITFSKKEKNVFKIKSIVWKRNCWHYRLAQSNKKPVSIVAEMSHQTWQESPHVSLGASQFSVNEKSLIQETLTNKNFSWCSKDMTKM